MRHCFISGIAMQGRGKRAVAPSRSCRMRAQRHGSCRCLTGGWTRCTANPSPGDGAPPWAPHGHRMGTAWLLWNGCGGGVHHGVYHHPAREHTLPDESWQSPTVTRAPSGMSTRSRMLQTRHRYLSTRLLEYCWNGCGGRAPFRINQRTCSPMSPSRQSGSAAEPPASPPPARSSARGRPGR